MPVNHNFKWDPIKDRDNWNKHDVAFDEAATICRDSKAHSIFDPDHSKTENDRSMVVNDLIRGDIKIAEAIE